MSVRVEHGDLLPFTLQCCETCGTEGRIISLRYRRWQEPDEVDHGECPDCEGQCARLFKTAPVTEEDVMDEEMMEALMKDGEMLRSLTGEDHGPYFVADCPTCNGTGKYWNGLLQEWRPCIDCKVQL